MNRPFYSEYVRHAMRFFSRNLICTNFKTEVDEFNWQSCYIVICRYTKQEQDILIYVYSSYDTLADNVYEMSKKYNINQNIIWDMMKEFEKLVAIERKLL